VIVDVVICAVSVLTLQERFAFVRVYSRHARRKHACALFVRRRRRASCKRASPPLKRVSFSSPTL